jgi:hypothetical protein
VLAADYPFLDLLWTMLLFFAWVAWFWLMFAVWADIFRRRDISGAKKVIWIAFTILLPFVGVFAYLIVNNEGMTERNLERMNQQQQQFDDYVRRTASDGGGAAAEIEKGQALLASGAITQSEFEALKAKVLAT